MIGPETADDAAVYRLGDGRVLIQTLDFFTPIVDDPYTYGQIAAANALSDIYAMGGTPFMALNIAAFPMRLGPDILGDILRGGRDKVQEAGAVVAGGHSVNDEEPKYGLVVSGFAREEEILSNATPDQGDRLILTKPIGTGVISTACKFNEASDEDLQAIIASMTALNRAGAEAVREVGGVHACTDVTGYGLMGHLYEMISPRNLGAVLYSREVPMFDRAKLIAWSEGGIVTRCTRETEASLQDRFLFPASMPEAERHLFFDPQTSGGLLAAVSPDRAALLLEAMCSRGVRHAAVIGEIREDIGRIIRVE